jgi:TolB protein
MRQFSLATDGRSLIHTAFATVSNLHSLPVSRTTGEPLGEAMALTSGTGRNSRPAFSPDGTWIAFDRWSVGMSQDIWVMRSDGSDARQLTLHPANDTQASWLPDGTGVTYSSDRDKQWSLFSARLEVAAEERLAVLETTIDALRLSPDGTAIAYHAPGANGTINLWVAAVDLSRARQLSFGGELVGFPCWSPDGRVLAAERRRGEDDHVVVVDVDGGSITQLTSAAGKHWPYSWSPDGDRVAFASLRDGYWNIWWVSRSTGVEQQLTAIKALNAYVRYPAWSPAGDEVVFEYAETVGDLWMLEGLERD